MSQNQFSQESVSWVFCHMDGNLTSRIHFLSFNKGSHGKSSCFCVSVPPDSPLKKKSSIFLVTYSDICIFHSIANVIYYLEPLSTESESFQSSVATKRLKGGHCSSLFWSIRRLRLFGFLQDHEFTSLPNRENSY